MTTVFEKDLERFGPAAPARAVDLRTARAYCRDLAQRHYENFTVASWLLPRDLRQHFCNVYSFCRWADDLGDETGSRQRSLELLDWWEGELRGAYAGQPGHPVFVALADTINEFAIPIGPFERLIAAFRQDQTKTRYESWAELLEYCRDSANPVGELVLYLGRCHNAENVALSDQICAGLQLANFCQDVARDYQIGRVYLPQEILRAAGCSDAEIARGVDTPEVCRAVESSVGRARQCFAAGAPLVNKVSAPIRLDVALFLAGGRAILAAIEKQNFAVLGRRPTLSKFDKLLLLVRSWLGLRGKQPAVEPAS